MGVGLGDSAVKFIGRKPATFDRLASDETNVPPMKSWNAKKPRVPA